MRERLDEPVHSAFADLETIFCMLFPLPVLPIASLTSFLALLIFFLLPTRPPWLLRRSLTLRNVFLACPWRLLLTLGCPLVRPLPLFLDCRASLLRRDLDWG